MKQTPLYERHKEDGGKMVEFAGYLMPVQFTSIMEEHHQVRESVGVFDVSHMGEVFIFGRDATKFLDFLLTNNIEKMKRMSCLYAIMCYENGTTVDDLIVYKYDAKKYLLVLNASNDDKDVAWIRGKSAGFDVTIDHVSSEFGELAIQGPFAEKLLIDLVDDAVESIGFFEFKEFTLGDIPLIISRTGYTGEDGFEVFMPSNRTLQFYSLLFGVSSVNLKPIGLGARDTLRFEVALPLYGHELSDKISPVEARLTYFIDFDKTDFVGKEALLSIHQNEDSLALVGFMLDEKGIAREGYLIADKDGNEIGHVTTGYLLDDREFALGLGYIPKKMGALGEKIYIKVRKNLIPATLIKRKFYTKKYKK